MVADTLSNSWDKGKNFLSHETQIGGEQVLLVKPQTYMNTSGNAVLLNMDYVDNDPSRIIVVHDDLDLAFGSLRIKKGGSDGGHKGVRSIIEQTSFSKFIRVKLGIGKPPEGIPVEKFVLSSFLSEEEETLQCLVRSSHKAIKTILDQGISVAQNNFNGFCRG
jgi:PTH1 family peptidyl-tRNA hydrolase